MAVERFDYSSEEDFQSALDSEAYESEMQGRAQYDAEMQAQGQFEAEQEANAQAEHEANMGYAAQAEAEAEAYNYQGGEEG